MTKAALAAVLERIAVLLDLNAGDPFRVKAYQAAARAIEQTPGDLDALAAAGFKGIRGVGESLRDHLADIHRTGTCDVLDELVARTPAGLIEMLRVPGLGPKKVSALHSALGVDSLGKLRVECDNGRVARLKGFGEKTQAKILSGLDFLAAAGERVRLDQALPLGLALLERVRAMPGVRRAEIGGSLRRRKETTGDIDILATADDPGPVMAAFRTLPEVREVTGSGDTKTSVIAVWHTGTRDITLAADLRVVAPESWAYALVHFTGSKDHNRRLRERAIDRGLKLNEYELASPDGNIPCPDEADVYRALGLSWIPPEMREDTGEVELAERGAVPALIEPRDIRGVFHNHTTYSDGTASLEEMAVAAKALGYEYFGVGDHSQSLKMAGGLSPAAVRKQHAEIDRVNARLTGVKILKGIECDILEDGTLDYDDETLASFEYVVASVHTYFEQPADVMTARVCRALRHPAITMLGHATGRLLLRRAGYAINLDEVLRVAAEARKMVEINAQPARLDLEWIYVKRARELGIPLVINPDAHSPEDLALTSYGVTVARRGWLSAGDVFNTRPLAEVEAELRRLRG